MSAYKKGKGTRESLRSLADASRAVRRLQNYRQRGPPIRFCILRGPKGKLTEELQGTVTPVCDESSGCHAVEIKERLELNGGSVHDRRWLGKLGLSFKKVAPRQ